METLAETFDRRRAEEPRFAFLVQTFCRLVEESVDDGAELFWRKVQCLCDNFPSSDVDACQFAILMAGHFPHIKKRGWFLFKSQEALVFGKDFTAKKLLGEL